VVSTLQVVMRDWLIGTLSHLGVAGSIERVAVYMQNSLRAISTVIIRTILCAEMTSCGLKSVSGDVMEDRV